MPDDELPDVPIKGVLAAIGLDGSIFAHPMNWPNVRSALGAIPHPLGLGLIPQDPPPDTN